MPANLQRKPTGTKSGLPEMPMQRMKALWKTLPESEQDYWRQQLSSSRLLSELRTEIRQKYQINFSGDCKVSHLRTWIAEQDERDAEAEHMLEDQDRLIKEFGTDNLDLVREKVLKLSYARTTSKKDIQLALATVRHDVSAKRVLIEERKLILLEKKSATADAAREALASMELTEEQKQQRIRELFGII
jgi:hypothetical protein